MGMIVTLYLISANVYNSVEGPKNRGFTYIEIWMVGMRIPIVIGIFEYATRFGNSMTNVSAYLSPLSFAIRFNVVAVGTRIRLTTEFNLWIARAEHIPAADTTNKLRMPID